MTSPQNPNPNGPLGDSRRVDREVGGGVRYGSTWIWVWILILAFIVAIVWFGGWGWAGYGGWWWGNRNARIQQPYGNTMNGSGVAVLNATNKQIYVGRPFNIQNVPVQSKINDQALWIGSTNASPMLVVLQGNDNSTANANIDQGNRINVAGTVQKAPDAATAKQQWNLSDDDANRLQQEGAYIQATEVTASQSSQSSQP